jgi:hypothetical protein
MLTFDGALKSQGFIEMRTAFASLILAAGLAAAAQAQVTPAPTMEATPPAPPAPAPTTAAPAAAPTTAAPTPGATAPAAAPEATPPAAPAAEAPPALPTTGDGATLISLIEKVCVPLVRGGNLDDLGKANAAMGLKKNRRDGSWTMPLGGDKAYNVTIISPGANKDVCRGEVHYALNQDKAIAAAINIWAFLHQPELILQANYVAVDADGVKRVRKSWEHFDAASSTAVNFSTWTKPDDTSLNGGYSTGEIYYQERKF